MFTNLRVRDFKSVADSGNLELPPLTLLMGPNSSGKSTLIQALLVARQTVDSRDLLNPLVVDGPYANLGSYREFVHRHERGRRVCFEFGLSLSHHAFASELQAETLHLTAEFSYNRKTLQIYPLLVSYAFSPTPSRIVKRWRTSADSTLEIYSSDDEPQPLLRTRTASSSKFYDCSRFLYGPELRRLTLHPGITRSRADAQRQAYRLTYTATDAFESQFTNTFYIGPLRTAPQRTYVAAGETPQDVGLRGESTPAILWASRWNRRLQERVLNPLNLWLASFGIAASLQVKRIGGSYFTMLFSDPALQVEANFADIGFGASQLLPALVETLYAPPTSTIVMEQPEIHLHPTAQATLGDFFVQQAGLEKQLIIETHSEHLLARVLRRIGEGKFSPRALAVYYCQPTDQGTQITRVPVNHLGHLEQPLPQGFLDQSYVESLAHVEAVAERVKQ